MSARLIRMNGTTERLRKQHEYQWIATHPKVQAIIREVISPKRKANKEPGGLTLHERNEAKRRKIKDERRNNVVAEIEDLINEESDPTNGHVCLLEDEFADK